MKVLFSSLFGFLLPIIPYFSQSMTGGYFLMPGILFALLFPIEYLVSNFKSNEEVHQEISYFEGVVLRTLGRLKLFSYVGSFIFILFVIQGETPLNQFILGINLCIISVLASTQMQDSSHSLIPIDEFFCKSYMVFTGYGHFKREREYHQYDSGNTGIGGVNRPGESVYQYVLRQIPIGIKHGCVLEEKILKGLGKEHLHNTIFWNYLSTTVLAFLVLEFFGEVSLAAFIAQMIVTIFMSYSLQYVQHYGMLSVNSIKSDEGLAWEHDMAMENMIFTNVGHHAKHHKNHFMPNFLVKKTKVNAPKLPCNYATMILFSLFPSFWFAWMDERLLNWHAESQKIYR